MLGMLARGETAAGDLGAPFRISQPAASKHIRVLERAKLITRRIDGRTHRLRLRPQPLDAAISWIERHRKFWEASLDNLGRVLEDLKKEERG